MLVDWGGSWAPEERRARTLPSNPAFRGAERERLHPNITEKTWR